MHFKAYRKVIYKDDGRDYVSIKEYIAIHVTFSALHSWITYFCIYTFFRCMNELLNFTDYREQLIDDSENWQKNIGLFGILAMLVMMIELCIYLAYYKDVIFATISLVNYVGMYIYNKEFGYFQHYITNTLIAFISITSCFIFLTLLYDYDKAFYMKHQIYEKKFKRAERKQEEKVQSKSSLQSKKRQETDGQYERSQSFAVWVQFQQIQKRNVMRGGFGSGAGGEIQETDNSSNTDYDDDDRIHDKEIEEEELMFENKGAELNEEGELVVQNVDDKELQTQKNQSFNNSELAKRKSSRYDIFETFTRKRQAQQAKTVLKNKLKPDKSRKTVRFGKSKGDDKSVQENKVIDPASYGDRSMQALLKLE